MFAFDFSFNGNMFKALARLRENADDRIYAVTVMNGELERQLFGNHFFCECNGALKAANSRAPEAVLQLQHSVAEGLNKAILVEAR